MKMDVKLVRNIAFVLMMCCIGLANRNVRAEDPNNCSANVSDGYFNFGPCDKTCDQMKQECKNFCSATGYSGIKWKTGGNNNTCLDADASYPGSSGACSCTTGLDEID